MQKIDWHNCFEFFTGAVSPNVRMSEKLLAFYHDHPAMNIRSRCSAGITFAMETDAEELALEFVFGESARTIYTCDLSVNGRIIPLDCREPQKTVLGSGVKNVIIYLPNMVVINDFTLAISDGAFYRALPHRQKKLLLCGDSIMQGMTCSTPSRALGALAADALDLELFNTSVGGAIMRSQAVAETLIYGGSNDIIAVGFGINDAARRTPPEDFRKETARVMELLNDFSGKALVATPLPAFHAAEEYRELYSSIIRECAEKYPQIKLLEGTDFYPRREELFADGLHPNDEGMKIYAENLVRAIRPELG